MKKLYVDRIIQNIAVCEDDDFDRTEIPLDDIGFKIHEGSVILSDGNGGYFLMKPRRKNGVTK